MENTVPRTNLSMSISVDSYVTRPGQSEAQPLGIRGELLHGRHIGPNADHLINR